MVVGWVGSSGAIGAGWIGGASSARTNRAEIPLVFAEAQNLELLAVFAVTRL